jgi:hypothetical protein
MDAARVAIQVVHSFASTIESDQHRRRQNAAED